MKDGVGNEFEIPPFPRLLELVVKDRIYEGKGWPVGARIVFRRDSNGVIHQRVTTEEPYLGGRREFSFVRVRHNVVMNFNILSRNEPFNVKEIEEIL